MTPRTHWRSCHRATPSRPRCCCSFRTEPCSCCLRTSWGIWSAGRRLQGDRTRSGRRPGTWCWATTWRSASGRLSHSSDRSSSSYWPTVDPRQKILVRLVEGDWTDSQSWITRTLNPPLIYAAICSHLGDFPSCTEHPLPSSKCYILSALDCSLCFALSIYTLLSFPSPLRSRQMLLPDPMFGFSLCCYEPALDLHKNYKLKYINM